jgi:hypothetical protein
LPRIRAAREARTIAPAVKAAERDGFLAAELPEDNEETLTADQVRDLLERTRP